MEDKGKVIGLLGDTLKATAQYRHLKYLLYAEGKDAYPYSEAIIAYWENGLITKINVSMDSGSAIIRDVMAHIDDEKEEE